MSPNVDVVVELVTGGIGAIFLLWIFTSITDVHKAESQKRIITSVAIFNGLILEVGISPLGILSSKLTDLTPLLPVEVSNLVYSFIAVGTFFETLYGLLKMGEGSGWPGIASFVLAFLGGAMLSYQDTMVGGVILIALAIPIVELIPANQRVRR